MGATMPQRTNGDKHSQLSTAEIKFFSLRERTGRGSG